MSHESLVALSKYFNDKDKTLLKGYTLELVLEDFIRTGLLGPEERGKYYVKDANCSLKEYLRLVETFIRVRPNWPLEELDIVRKLTLVAGGSKKNRA